MATGAVSLAASLLMNLPPSSTPRTRSLIALVEAVWVSFHGGRGALAAVLEPWLVTPVTPVLWFMTRVSRLGSREIGSMAMAPGRIVGQSLPEG